MTIVDRFIKVVAGAGLCGAALALSPGAAAAPLMTGGGYECMQGSAAAGTPAAAAGAPVAACTASAPLADMAGVPLALPGPVPAAPPVPVIPPPPLAPPPLAPPVPVAPVGAPVPAGAPVAAGAPLADMAGTYGGKGDPIRPAPVGGPMPGQPVIPGPS